MPIQVFKGSVPTKQKQFVPAVNRLLDKTVFVTGEDQRKFVGLVKGTAEGGVKIALAVPNEDGLLLVTDQEIIVREEQVEIFAGVSQESKLRKFDSVTFLEDEQVKMAEVKDEATKLVVDYRDVMFEGFASTFASTTPKDRQGDYINEGAFTKTIAGFMRNPVMLIDHENSVRKIAGSYTKLTQTETGLAVQGKLSNAPSLRDVRFLVVEKHLRAMSIGGMFFYGEDGREIMEVELYEISLVAVPANMDALFQVRKISIDDAASAYKTFVSKSNTRFQIK